MSSCTVTMRFADSAQREIIVAPGANLLDAALAAGVELVHQCRTGSCGTCICRRLNGAVPMVASTSVALLPTERADGHILSCLTRVESDAIVEFPYESSVLDRNPAVTFEAEIVEIERLSASVVRLTVEAINEAPDFLPGSYFMLEVPDAGVARAYSPYTRSEDLPTLSFLMRLLPGGVMSTFLDRAEPGDVLKIEGPFGEFHWRQTMAPLVLIAGGTGVAPILSILDTIAAERRHRERILLCMGVNTEEDMFFLDELALREQLMPRLEVRVAVASQGSTWQGAVGHVTHLVTDADLSAECCAYLCGPPPMVAEAVRLLTAAGVSEQNIHFEKFNPAIPEIAA